MLALIQESELLRNRLSVRAIRAKEAPSVWLRADYICQLAILLFRSANIPFFLANNHLNNYL